MPNFNSNELIKRVEKEGFELHRIKGSHHIYKHTNGKRIVIPHPKKDLPKGTFYSILRQAGLR